MAGIIPYGGDAVLPDNSKGWFPSTSDCGDLPAGAASIVLEFAMALVEIAMGKISLSYGIPQAKN